MVQKPSTYVYREIQLCEVDLHLARRSLSEHSNRWATIQACSSGFHGIRALLLARGYRGRTRYGLKTALTAHYVDVGLLPPDFLRVFDQVMSQRERVDGQYSIPSAKAGLAVRLAEEVLRRARSLLD
jgi:uncharacterized protein (UPF0332 family)